MQGHSPHITGLTGQSIFLLKKLEHLVSHREIEGFRGLTIDLTVEFKSLEYANVRDNKWGRDLKSHSHFAFDMLQNLIVGALTCRP
jgi:hypothetical protein